MKQFLCDNFLLETETARTLYHGFAAYMPIFDYHCHLEPSDIAENRIFDNLTQVWLSHDHYKWRLMRACGVDESCVTGDAPDFDKFRAFAGILPRCVGNPVYHFSHLELKNYFGISPFLSAQSADEIWGVCNNRLKALPTRQILRRSHVKALCTIDDPADTLAHHRAMSDDPTLDTRVFPTFRPENVFGIDKPGFAAYIGRLSEAASLNISNFSDLERALKNRMDHFDTHGCLGADLGLDYICFRRGDPEMAYRKAIRREEAGREEAEVFKTELLLFCAREYAKRGWVMQLHYNVLRGNHPALTHVAGPNIGCDALRTHDGSAALASLLNTLSETGELPRTILFSLNPVDNTMLSALAGCYPDVQHGAAWWFNDSKPGIEAHLTNLAATGVLGNFLGMLTDSRCLLSYARHEYFRRILCNLLGRWVEDGEYPNDMDTLGKLVQDISYNNAKQFFRA